GRVVADAVAKAHAGPGQAQVAGVVVGGVELLRPERRGADVGAEIVERRHDEAAPGRQLDLPLEFHPSKLPPATGTARGRWDTARRARASSGPGPWRCQPPSPSISQAACSRKMSSVASRRAR